MDIIKQELGVAFQFIRWTGRSNQIVFGPFWVCLNDIVDFLELVERNIHAKNLFD